MSEVLEAIIQQQNAVLTRAEIDMGTVAVRLERQMLELQAAAGREMRQINDRAIRRVQELGAEYKRLAEARPAGSEQERGDE